MKIFENIMNSLNSYKIRSAVIRNFDEILSVKYVISLNFQKKIYEVTIIIIKRGWKPFHLICIRNV